MLNKVTAHVELTIRMKPFDEWVKDFEAYPKKSDSMEEYEFFGEIEGLSYPCCVCDQLTPIECDPNEFDPEMNYCGRSERCCP